MRPLQPSASRLTPLLHRRTTRAGDTPVGADPVRDCAATSRTLDEPGHHPGVLRCKKCAGLAAHLVMQSMHDTRYKPQLRCFLP